MGQISVEIYNPPGSTLSDNQQDDEAREIGAGWKHVGEKAGDYVAIQIDDPMFLAPLRANIFKDDDGHHHLVWSRPSKRDGEG